MSEQFTQSHAKPRKRRHFPKPSRRETAGLSLAAVVLIAGLGSQALKGGSGTVQPGGHTSRPVAAAQKAFGGAEAQATSNALEGFVQNQDRATEASFQSKMKHAARKVVNSIVGGINSGNPNAQPYQGDSIWINPNPGANQNELSASYTPGKGNTGTFQVMEINQTGNNPNDDKNRYTAFETDMEISGPEAQTLNSKVRNHDALTTDDFTALAYDPSAVVTRAQVQVPIAGGRSTTLTVTDVSHSMREQNDMSLISSSPTTLTYPGLQVAVQNFDRQATAAQTAITHDMSRAA